MELIPVGLDQDALLWPPEIRPVTIGLPVHLWWGDRLPLHQVEDDCLKQGPRLTDVGVSPLNHGLEKTSPFSSLSETGVVGEGFIVEQLKPVSLHEGADELALREDSSKIEKGSGRGCYGQSVCQSYVGLGQVSRLVDYQTGYPPFAIDPQA